MSRDTFTQKDNPTGQTTGKPPVGLTPRVSSTIPPVPAPVTADPAEADQLLAELIADMDAALAEGKEVQS